FRARVAEYRRIPGTAAARMPHTVVRNGSAPPNGTPRRTTSDTTPDHVPERPRPARAHSGHGPQPLPLPQPVGPARARTRRLPDPGTRRGLPPLVAPGP